MRTPAGAGLAYDSVEFDPSAEGTPQLKGWWIAAAPSAPFGRYTVLYLHGQTGNMGDQVDALAALHAVGVNAMSFDYRGYGLSQFVRPSESQWRQDAKSALEYLTATRHVDAGSIVLEGEGLGANLALETGAAHSELAGMILESPLGNPTNVIFNDARAKLVPARLLVRDRWDLNSAAARVNLPVLWLEQDTEGVGAGKQPEAYTAIVPRRTLIWVGEDSNQSAMYRSTLTHWLGELSRH